jgi:hypothetical protein
MDNSMRHYLGYDYCLVQGHVSSEPLVLSYQCQGGKLHTLRVQDQAKQAVYSGPSILH